LDPLASNELVIIRHAPAAHGGRLCGHLDVEATLPERAALAPLRAALEGAHLVSSPALRCRQTLTALTDEQTFEEDPRLWEQDFGAQDGASLADLPDLGPMSLAYLAAHRMSGAESFEDMAARVIPALETLAARIQQGGGPVAVVAHAGTARAALGMALGRMHLGLAFEIAPLSLTRLRCLPDGFGIIAVNQQVSMP
jgi:alpha-ribazole phosphatase